MHAIGHYARSLYPHVKVRYVNSEEFTNDFINSIRDDRAANFQSRYREVDVLLIDDIQFLSPTSRSSSPATSTPSSSAGSNSGWCRGSSGDC